MKQMSDARLSLWIRIVLVFCMAGFGLYKTNQMASTTVESDVRVTASDRRKSSTVTAGLQTDSVQHVFEALLAELRADPPRSFIALGDRKGDAVGNDTTFITLVAHPTRDLILSLHAIGR